jgi:Rrf2 family protein
MAALQISRKVDYALRAVVHLASQDGDRGCTLGDIAAHVAVSPQFLAKIIEQLAHRGLVRSRRGPKGGYVIGRPLTEVSMYDVMDAVEGPIALNKCLVGRDECSQLPNCGMTSVWKEAQDRLVDVLANTTLADIQRRRRPARKRQARTPSS